MLKRLFDIIVSGTGLLFASPIFLLLAIWIKLDSKGPVFYRQVRVGRWNKDFRIYKFRSMRVGADKGSLITVGGRDPRITRSGYFIRKFKFDELPQLINVFLGDMSLVGPRPEVRHYVDMYNEEQLHVLDVRPGITDLASIKYRNENELLEQAEDPEWYYINVIMPDKLRLNLEYVANSSFFYDISMIFKTIWSLSVLKFIRAFFSWYFGKDSLPYWCVLAFDGIILVTLFYFGNFCVLGSKGVVDDFWEKLAFICLCVVPFFVFYRIFHTYQNIIRYSSFVDLKNIIIANMLGTMIVIAMRYFYFGQYGEWFPGYRVAIYAFAFSTVCMCSWRILIKNLYEIANVKAEAKNVAVYGVKDAGVSIAKSIRTQHSSDFVVSCFIAPKEDVQTSFMCGLPVFKDDITLIEQLRRKHVNAIMVSPLQSEKFRNNERLINALTELGIHIYMMPEARKWDVKKDVHFQMLRNVDIEDLLPREHIDIDEHAISDIIAGKRVMITGAAGSIGRELARQLAEYKPQELVFVDQAESPLQEMTMCMRRVYSDVKCKAVVADISNEKRMELTFKAYRPDCVFHASAYKHVPMMEENPAEAILNNIYGTRIVADMSVKYGVKTFVMLSTDKAFNPTNVIGCTKRIGEAYCQSLNNAMHDGTVAGNTKFIISRFGNVLGSSGSVVQIFKDQIRRGGPVTVTHQDAIRYFMFVADTCKLLLHTAATAKGGDILFFNMGKAMKIDDLAKRLIALSGATNIEIEYTGLRDGEKVFEELLSSTEKLQQTSNDKIQIVPARQYPYHEIQSAIDNLCTVCLELDNTSLIKAMKKILHE